MTPHPVAWHVSRWADDPWARGSWSYLRPGASAADRVALGEPVDGRLILCGEATSPDHPAMAHGAYTSGLRAARWCSANLPGGARVLVVGAGLAGLTAARALLDDGMRPVVVEARRRVGGRVHPVVLAGDGDDPGRSAPVSADGGAGWLQEWERNPLARLAERLGLAFVETDFAHPVERPTPTVDGACELLGERIRHVTGSGDVSLAEALAGWSDGLAPDRWRAVQRVLDAAIDAEFGAPFDQLSARAAIGEPGVGDGDRMIVGGYRPLLEHLVGGRGDRLDIRLGHVIEQIGRHDGGAVVSGPWGVLRGDAAVVTLPVGVLRSGSVTFEPELPTTHLDALARMGMGVVEKVLLRFAERWWPILPGGCFHWFEEPASWVEWADLTDACDAPVVAAFIAGGAVGRRHGGRSDTEIAVAASAALGRFVAA